MTTKDVTMRLIVLAFAGLLALAAASNEKKVVCYFGSWAVYRRNNGEFPIDMIDPHLCTHLIYGFAGLNFDGTIRSLDKWADLADGGGKDGFAKFNKLRSINPKLKTMIAMGGWNEGIKEEKRPGNEFYSQVMSDPSLRSKLITSIVEFLEKYNFDGFDLDWEYPGPTRPGGRPEDKTNLVLFLKELKEAFEPRGFILSAAVGASPATAKTAYDIAGISKYLDFINMMEYDFHVAGEGKTGHNAPLFHASWEDDNTLNVDASIQYWIEQGAPAEKIVMGIPLYGRGFTLTDTSNKRVNSPAGASHPGPHTQEPGMLGYNEICENINQWEVVFDEAQRVPYAHNGDQWVSFDDERSIAEKGDYVNKYGLGGMMVWSLEMDDFRGVCGKNYPLLRAINKALGGIVSNEIEDEPEAPKVKPVEVKKTKRQSSQSTAFKPKTPTAAPTQDHYNPPVQHNQPGAVCQGPGYIRDSNDCSTFYQCVFNGNNYHPAKFTCSSGLAWDMNTKTCNFKDQVQC